jgi:two-component system cell cycle sensor histidine kinase/response regulator CckA
MHARTRRPPRSTHHSPAVGCQLHALGSVHHASTAAPASACTDERHLVEAQRLAHVGSFEYDHTEDRLQWSAEMFRIFGIAPDAFRGRAADFFDRIHPEDRERVERRVRNVLARGLPFDAEYRIVRPDGSVRHVHARFETSTDPDGRPRRSIGIVQDITDRALVERALQDSHQFAYEVLNSAQEGIVVIDRQKRCRLWNAYMEAMTGLPLAEVLGRQVWDVLPLFREAPGEALLDRALAGETVEIPDTEYDHAAHGRLQWVTGRVAPLRDARGRVVGVTATLQDVSQRKTAEVALQQTQEQLLQAQKMEAVGRLAGGIAHDFNNLLTAILGYGQFLLESHPPGDPLHTDVTEIMRAGERAAALTRQLLAFGRRQVLEPRVIDLNEVVANVAKLLERVIGEDIELAILTGAGLWRVFADPTQIERILMNLAVNARDAMPDGGRLTIETANVLYRPEMVRHRPGMKPGSYVRLVVSDTGVGMPAEVRAHIFEPFFTTKATGRGTGLGLATVYGIVKQSNGFIWCDSAPGRGTTFEILLPKVEGEPEPVAPPGSLAQPNGHGETILLVEDDPAVRDLARAVLEAKGYLVLAAADGAEALALAARHAGPVDVLLTDVVMPGLSGREVAERLSAARPALRVVYMSGYPDDIIGQRGVIEPHVRFLQKPFTASTLLARVREALGS